MSERGCGSLVLCFAWFALSLRFIATQAEQMNKEEPH